MKKLLILVAMSGVILLAGSCKKDYLDLQYADKITESAYFKTPAQFKAAANSFYDKMISWQPIGGSSVYDFMDNGSDLSSNVTVNAEGGYPAYGRGSVNAPTKDKYWNNPYAYIRD